MLPLPPSLRRAFLARVGSTQDIDALYAEDSLFALLKLARNTAANRVVAVPASGEAEGSRRARSWLWATWPQSDIDARAAKAARRNEQDRYDELYTPCSVKKINGKPGVRWGNRMVRTFDCNRPIAGQSTSAQSITPIVPPRLIPRSPRADFSGQNLVIVAHGARIACNARPRQVFPTRPRPRQPAQAPFPTIVVHDTARSGRLHNAQTGRRPTQAPAVTVSVAPRTRTRSASSRYSGESVVDPAMQRKLANAPATYGFI